MWPPGCDSRSGRRRLLIVFWCMFVVGTTVLIDRADGFNLQVTQKQAGAAGGSAAAVAAKSSKTMFKEMPMRKIARIVKDTESGPDEDDDDEDGKVEDDDDEVEAPPAYIFEKVHSTHFDLPKKIVEEPSESDVDSEEADDDNDDDDDDDKDKDAEEDKSADQDGSILDPLYQFAASLWPESDPSEPGWIEWLQSLRKSEEEKAKSKEKPIEPTEEDDSTDSESSWWSYLDQKPFRVVFDYLVTNVQSIKEAVEKEVAEVVAELKEEPRQPMPAKHFENLLLTVSSFVPNYTNVANIDCKRMGQIFQRQVRGQKLWALQMMDASAKISSGVLRGNTNQLGDFDACTEIRTKVKIKENQSIKIRGKYCLANVDIVASDDDLKLPVHLMQGRNMLRSHVDDPIHFIPRFSTIQWALCVPSACTSDDAQEILTELLEPFNSSGLEMTVEVSDENCVVRSRQTWSDLIKANWQISATIGYFTFFIVVTVVASLNDYWKMLKLDVIFADPVQQDDAELVEDNGEKMPSDGEKVDAEEVADVPEEGLVHRMLMAFSLKTTGHTLFSFAPVENDDQIIYCIYGLKGLATIFLFFSFKVLIIGHLPFTNRVALTEMMNSPLSVFIRAAILYMDVFLLASGFFAGYKISKDVEVRFRIPWARRIGARVVRLLPSVLALVLFTSWIFPYIGSGPQWEQLVVRNAELCRGRMWPHMLFLQNWIPIDEQCAPQLQHLSVDMQLYVLAPVIIWLFSRDATWGFGAFGVLNAFSAAMRYSTTISERLSVVVFHGMKLTQLYRTINIALASPLQRATAFSVGLGLGIMLSQVGRNVQIPKAIFVTGWLTCLWSIVWCFWTPVDLSHKDYIYDPSSAAEYATWTPLVWSLAIAWIIFVVFTRNDGLFTKCLTLRPLIFISRISYQIFCVQFLVLIYSAATVRSAESFGFWSLVNPFEIFLVFSGSILTTLVFDIPLQAIARMIVVHGVDDDIAAEAQRLEALESKPEETQEKTVLEPIEETDELSDAATSPSPPPPDEEPAADAAEPEVMRRRSFSPVWTKDEEPPAWGDDDSSEQPPEESSEPPPPPHDIDEEDDAADEDVDEIEIIEPPLSQSNEDLRENGVSSSAGGEQRFDGLEDEYDSEEYSDRDDDLDFSGDSEDSEQRAWLG